MMKGVNLRGYEVERLAKCGSVLVVRTLKEQPRGVVTSAIQWLDGLWRIDHEPVPNILPDGAQLGNVVGIRLRCPLGRAGDEFWIKEAFARRDDFDWKADLPKTLHYIHYKADYDGDLRDEWHDYGSWRSSATMPRELSRFTVVVEGVQCKRIRSTTNDEAVRMGLDPVMVDSGGVTPWGDWIEVPDFEDPLIDAVGFETWAEDRYCWFATLRKESCRGSSTTSSYAT